MDKDDFNDKVTAGSFITLWNDFHEWNNKIELLGVPYNSLFNTGTSSEWTKFIFTHPFEKVEEKSSLLEHLISQKYKLSISLEWRKFDLTAYTANYFDSLKLYDNSSPKENHVFDFPKEIEILLEHENDCRICNEEIVKLVYERARLKVLITYPENQSNEVYLKNNLSQIVRQSNRKYPENNDTEYLLILGSSLKDRINWKYFVCDINGVEKNWA